MNTKAKILIVDDEEVVRLSFLRILGGTSNVKAVSGWSQISQLMQQEPFDVVLLDLRMPDMDGISVLKALKQRWPESEVIIVTGYPTLESAKEAVALGAYDYLSKPVAPGQVIEASNAAMEHKRWALHNDIGLPRETGATEVSPAVTAGLPSKPDFTRTSS